MIPTRPAPKYSPGTRVHVVQHVRVGGERWTTEVSGTIEDEGQRPIGGMEMGAKALISRQPTLRLRRNDGEITVVAVDEHTHVTILPEV